MITICWTWQVQKKKKKRNVQKVGRRSDVKQYIRSFAEVQDERVEKALIGPKNRSLRLHYERDNN
jgi:hypothetical protein